MPTSGSDPVVMFYSGGRDSEGRTLDELLSWTNERLEAVHDYIQWMFPTAHPSGVNPWAPLITPETVEAFAHDEALRRRLRGAFERMLSFYGLVWRKARVELDVATFEARAATWLHPGNHNHLRLTRIMESLAALGLRSEAQALQQCLLERVCGGPGRGRVTPRTLEFWRSAT